MRDRKRPESIKDIRLHNNKKSQVLHSTINMIVLGYAIAAFVYTIIKLSLTGTVCTKKVRDMIIVFIVRTGVLIGITGFSAFATFIHKKP